MGKIKDLLKSIFETLRDSLFFVGDNSGIPTSSYPSPGVKAIEDEIYGNPHHTNPNSNFYNSPFLLNKQYRNRDKNKNKNQDNNYKNQDMVR